VFTFTAFASLLAIAIVHADDADPFGSGTEQESAKWSSPKDVLAKLPEKNSAVVYSSIPGHCVAFGVEPITVLNFKTGEILGEIPIKLSYSSSIAALSPTGEYFAHAEPGTGGGESLVVYRVATGEDVFRRSGTAKESLKVKFLRFTKHGHLVSIVRGSTDDEVRITSIPAGATLKAFKVKSVGDERTKIALSPDGRHLALSYWETLNIFDLVKGKSIGWMARPPAKPNSNPLNFITGLAFSPEGTELAAIISEGATNRFVVWNASGNVIDDFSLGTSISVTHLQGDPVQWSPDGQGWLLLGTSFVDRRLKAVAWRMERQGFLTVPGQWLDDSHVVVGFTSGSTEDIKVLEVPRDEIRRGVDAVTGASTSDDALLKPGQSVSVEVKVGAVEHSSLDDVRKALLDTATARLEQGGLVVSPGQPTVLSLNYGESTGDELRVVKGGLGFGGKDTGQRVRETVGVLDAKLTLSGGKEVAWEESIKRGNPHHVQSETINEETVRKAMFSQVQYPVSTLKIPYFIAGDGSTPTLPIEVSLD